MKAVSYILIILFILFSLVNAQDYVKIKYFYYPKTFIVEQGKSNSSFVMLENQYNETLYNIFLKFQLPNGIEASQKETGLEELLPNQKGSISFNLKATTIANGTYNVTVWAESINQIGSNYIQSPKQTFVLIVLKNNITEIGTTTTTQVINTSTTSILNQSITNPQQNNTIIQSNKRIISPIFAGIGLLLILIVFLIFMKR